MKDVEGVVGEEGGEMKLENQVCAREWAMKLEKLGVKQKSLWWWEIRKGVKGEMWSSANTRISRYKSLEGQRGIEFEYISAFTVAELGEMLPLNLFLSNCMPSLSINKHSKQWSVSYLYNQENSPDLNIEHNKNIIWHKEIANTEANARAAMLVYLKEESLEE